MSSAADVPAAQGFVLAGGRSSRMGADKAVVELGGRPLIAHALELLQQAGLAAWIAGGQPSLAAFAPLVTDAQAHLGPLGGVCAGLAATPAEWAVFLSVDAPFIPASLLRFMLSHALTSGSAVTLCSADGVPQTFPVVLNRAVLPLLARELAAGRLGCLAAFEAAAAGLDQAVSILAAEALAQTQQAVHPQALPVARWFLNLNSADELEDARRHSALLLEGGVG